LTHIRQLNISQTVNYFFPSVFFSQLFWAWLNDPFIIEGSLLDDFKMQKMTQFVLGSVIFGLLRSQVPAK
jgi:hypothetical protein